MIFYDEPVRNLIRDQRASNPSQWIGSQGLKLQGGFDIRRKDFAGLKKWFLEKVLEFFSEIQNMVYVVVIVEQFNEKRILATLESMEKHLMRSSKKWKNFLL
ncbi:MAG: hypothetical protein JRC68_03870 [Deltaproteobacteria bacterium]|nr:hypothetical protein [Deltaproteobacteria bacterium]